MKKLSVILATATLLFFVSFATAQLTVSAETGATFFIAERSTALPAPMLGVRVGYQVNPSEVVRVNGFAGVGIRNFRTMPLFNNPEQKIWANSDFALAAGAGFSLGDRFRLGVNGGVQASPGRRQEVSNNKNIVANRSAFGEGTISYFSKRSNSEGGFSIKAEKSQFATDHFKESIVGKNTGIATVSVFIRQVLGKRKTKKTENHSVTPDIGTPPVRQSQNGSKQDFPSFRDNLLRDSIFGQAMAQFVAQVSREAALFAIDSSRKERDLAIAQAHSKTMAEVRKAIGDAQLAGGKSYQRDSTPQYQGFRHVLPIFYGNCEFSLTVGQKQAITNKTRGLATNTKFVVSSFTSDVGTLQFNEDLCKKRNDGVTAFLRTLGFSNFQIYLSPRMSSEDGDRQTLIQF